MKKVKNQKYLLPINIKTKDNENKDDKSKEDERLKIITIILIIMFVILLLFGGYSLAKGIEETIISSNTQIAEPILIIENNPSIDITATQNVGTYFFKIKNYNENKLSDVNLKYYIEIISNVDESINFKLYENEKEINLNNNKSDYLKLSKDIRKENEYKLQITYNKDKSTSIGDIIQKVQIKVHTEQEKG